MATLQQLGAADLKAAVLGYRDVLRSHKEVINRLNVYPVPDGDTGTNMALTLDSVATEVEPADDLAGVCKAISHGSLMGARGNSGVILSQVLRGIADVCKTCDGDDGIRPRDIAAALDAASTAAYQAVMRPVEGTILTVVKAAATAAQEVEGSASSLVQLLERARAGAVDALERTPELLPVLKQAGVVDAGGAGFVLFLDALLNVVDGRALPDPPQDSADGVAARAGAAIDAMHHGGGEAVGDLRYEVMYFLEAADETIPAFKEVWSTIGDSIV
ncbi:MAG TPA: DAK2 domain-containing protein, partial [Acidimicrobiales bacterium]|nr:DAK2 domain-containing protein [Acidimicrobiales bacterium]